MWLTRTKSFVPIILILASAIGLGCGSGSQTNDRRVAASGASSHTQTNENTMRTSESSSRRTERYNHQSVSAGEWTLETWTSGGLYRHDIFRVGIGLTLSRQSTERTETPHVSIIVGLCQDDGARVREAIVLPQLQRSDDNTAKWSMVANDVFPYDRALPEGGVPPIGSYHLAVKVSIAGGAELKPPPMPINVIGFSEGPRG